MHGNRYWGALAAALFVGCVQAEDETWQRLERIDVTPAGMAATPAQIDSASISDDGRWIVYSSTANYLVASDTNGFSDVFARDRRMNSTVRLSLRPGAVQTSGANLAVSASADGRYVTFVSSDAGLVAADTNNVPDQFLLDRDADGDGFFDEIGATSIERISINRVGGELVAGARNLVGAVSDSGTSIAFVTEQNIAANDSNGTNDVYVRDRRAPDTRLMSQSSEGVVGNEASPGFFAPPLRISDSGASVAFTSVANNLAPGDSGFFSDIFVRLRDEDGDGIFDEPGSSRTIRANTLPGGAPLPIGSTSYDLSGDGRWLAIPSSDPTGPNPNGTDIFLRDIVADTTAPILFPSTKWSKGGGTCCGNQNPLISRGAAVVAFTSNQNHLVNGANASRSDVFVKAQGSGPVRLTDYPVPTVAAPGHLSIAVALSANGAYLLVGTYNLGASPIPEEGHFVYQRNRVFKAGFESE